MPPLPPVNDPSPSPAAPAALDISRVLAARYAQAKSDRRQADRERIHTQVVRPIDTPRLIADPLARPSSRLTSTVTGARLLLAALVIHGVIIVVFSVAHRMRGPQQDRSPGDRIVLRIVETPPEPPPVEEPEVVVAPIAPDFAPEKPEPPKRKKPRKLKVVQAVVQPEAPTPEPARRRIIGLSMESTVRGSGPSFATGTSRMGQTARRAVDPELAARRPVGQAVQRGPSVRQQRAATRIPTRDSVFVKPRRSRPSKPGYPITLKAQGIEGEVLVRVDISAGGLVTAVTILRGSGHAAFDEAARKAAADERFSPATRDGRPVAFTLSYEYRFRIED